jgi:RNA polymerase sigma factor (TIGR02999 family)
LKTRPSTREVTQLLVAWSNGDEKAFEALAPLVYQELHRLAQGYMKKERRGHTLQTTALIHEAYMRLIDARNLDWKNRAHFFAISARLMRRILVDHARAHNVAKRGGQEQHVPVEDAALFAPGRTPDLVALDDALQALATFDPRKSEVIELRFFGGLSVEETAQVLKLSADTVMRDWRLARSWLLRELSPPETDDGKDGS